MKLARREKLFVSAAACILGIFLIIELLIIPFSNKKEHLEKETETIEKSMQNLNRLSAGGENIDKVSGGLETVISSRGGESLYAFVNKEAEAIGLNKNMARVTPSEGKKQGDYIEDIVEIQLDAITQPQLTEYLYRIEKPENFIFINKITIKDNKREEGYLDTTIRVLTYKKGNRTG